MSRMLSQEEAKRIENRFKYWNIEYFEAIKIPDSRFFPNPTETV